MNDDPEAITQKIIEATAAAVRRLRAVTSLPVAVGFGIKTPEQAADIARVADAAVVGSALVQRVSDHLDGHGGAGPGVVPAVVDFVRGLADVVAGGNGR